MLQPGVPEGSILSPVQHDDRAACTKRSQLPSLHGARQQAQILYTAAHQGARLVPSGRNQRRKSSVCASGGHCAGVAPALALEGKNPTPCASRGAQELRKLAGVARCVQAVSKRPRLGLLLVAFGQQKLAVDVLLQPQR